MRRGLAGVKMHMDRNARASGFTLIELLIVVAILGIMAAIVVPRFSDASAQAKNESQRAQLQQVRRQIELYRLDYAGALPDLTGGWEPMTEAGLYNGKKVGPYFQSIPRNSINGRTNVVDGSGAGPAGSACGFMYDYAAGAGTGTIQATKADGTTIFP